MTDTTAPSHICANCGGHVSGRGKYCSDACYRQVYYRKNPEKYPKAPGHPRLPKKVYTLADGKQVSPDSLRQLLRYRSLFGGDRLTGPSGEPLVVVRDPTGSLDLHPVKSKLLQ